MPLTLKNQMQLRFHGRNLSGVVRIMAPKVDRVLIPGTCENLPYMAKGLCMCA